VSQTSGTPASRRVVVAEDETLIRLDLVEMLGEEGYQVVGEAGDGETAVEMVLETQPDLVVLDVKMPRLDGISAAKKIAENRTAPVVILTAFSQRDLVERARDAGAMAYLVKPFDKSSLTLPGDHPAGTRGRRPRRAPRDPEDRRPGQGSAAGQVPDDRAGGVPVDPEGRDGQADHDARRREGDRGGDRGLRRRQLRPPAGAAS